MPKTISLPGLIDPHVHLRDPGQTHKEDFLSGTSAALAGGFTTVLDMPNNAEPVTTADRLEQKIALAEQKTVIDIGFHFGSLGDNFDEFNKVIDKVHGLKLYLNVTTGNFIIDKDKLIEIYKAWPGVRPILLHAEEDVSELVFGTLSEVKKPTHICHVSSQKELEFVIRAKDKGLPITCGVTPHHLFLSDKDVERLGGRANVKPYLKPAKDQQFIWDHLDYVDVVESDHAPHTLEEKMSDNPPFGLPGLETTLALMLTAEAEGKLTRQKLLSLLHNRSAEIFDIKIDPETSVEVDMSEYEISPIGLKTRAGWTPYEGFKVVGKVTEVKIRGELAYKNGEILATAGSGRVI